MNIRSNTNNIKIKLTTLIVSMLVFNICSSSIENLIRDLKNKQVEFLIVTYPQLFAEPSCITVPMSQAEHIFSHGVSWSTHVPFNHPDKKLIPDPAACYIVPEHVFNKKVAFVLSYQFSQTSQLSQESQQLGDHIASRALLQAVEKEAEELGYWLHVGAELEVSLFKKSDIINNTIVGSPSKKHHLHLNSPANDDTYSVVWEIVQTLEKMGVPIEIAHHECAPFAYEFVLKYDRASIMADRIVIAKQIIQRIAKNHKLHASFMPKPLADKEGNGMHFHYSLYDYRNNRNAFFDQKGLHSLSELAYHFLAGNLAYTKECTAIFASTTNSYKRIIKSVIAPRAICWGNNNRTALIRIPAIAKIQSNQARLEFRLPDVLSDPYLTLATILKSGLVGLKEKLEPAKECTQSISGLSKNELKELGIDLLPPNLSEAIAEIQKSEFVKTLLGKDGFTFYLRKLKEKAKLFDTTISQLEYDLYL